MRQLSPAGQQAVNDIAQRHGFGADAVASMLDAVISGNGTMAQFEHPEFGGSGQWMQGGMIMLSDMFNNYLKGRIDSLCNELSNLVASQPGLIQTGSFQSQSQSGSGPGSFQQQGSGGMIGNFGASSLFVPPEPGQGAFWWPAELGQPSSTGAQNNVRYAWFSGPRRLAIDVNGKVTVYDTLDHNIGGFSQQQSYGGTLSFTSQYGLIDIAALPVVSIDGVAPPPPAAAPVFASEPLPVPGPTPAAPVLPTAPVFEAAPAPAAEQDIFAMIEKLAALKAKGILTDEEFAAKKAELLARL